MFVSNALASDEANLRFQKSAAGFAQSHNVAAAVIAIEAA
jgi:hypothetical protein